MKYLHQKLFLALGLLLFSVQSVFPKISATYGDYEYSFSGKFRPETFYAKNLSLLNNSLDADQIWYARHILDLDLDVLYGKQTYSATVAEFYFTLRNKSIWGDPSSIASTTETDVKILDAVGKGHKHAIPRHIFWMREAWLRLDLAEFLHLPFLNKHSFTMGAFSFKLGRGIALGDAYAVGPDFLGYYTEFNVDQYAFGAKLSGYAVQGVVAYDLYAGILQNKSGNLSDTGANIYSQEYGRIKKAQRGFGNINYVFAGRIDWTVFDNQKLGALHVEPYGLFNHDPEQRVEFLGDAESRLGTLGMATDYRGTVFEFGFDYAFNLGQQRVKGWDRNQIKEENREGFLAFSNSHVVDQDGKKILFVAGSKEQKIIDCTYEDETQNGITIGTVNKKVRTCDDQNIVICEDREESLINKNNRFRDPYTNRYRGWMFIADGSLWVYKHDLQIAAMAGIASGDDNPNLETVDGDYTGFIGLQEVYSGGRVKSAFVLGGAGKLRRPLAEPTSVQSPSRFAQNISRFTDLVVAGAALKWDPRDWQNAILIHPNIIFYWEDKPINKFDVCAKKELNEKASTFLGVEANVFFHYCPIKSMKFYVVGSLFFPGQHYTDIRGRPLNSAQVAELDRWDETGHDQPIPNLGDNVAFTTNVGFEFKF